MKLPPKLMRLVVVLLIGGAAFLVYRNMGPLKIPGLTRPSTVRVATPPRMGQVPPPGTRPTAPPAGGIPGVKQGLPPASGLAAPPAMGTPPKATGTPPSPGTSPAAGTTAPSKVGTPGQAPQGAPAPGRPPLPTKVASTEVNPTAEAALVGKGEQGRPDPFAPLMTSEAGGLGAMPPLPSGSFPQPPGFVAPGGPGMPPPVGGGMRVAGIMGSRSRVAIIESDGRTYIVRAGERVGDAVVVSVLPDRVVVKQNNVTFELNVGGAS